MINKNTPAVSEIIEYNLLESDDVEQTAACFADIFLLEEPMTRSLGLSQQQFRIITKKYCQIAAEDGLSFIAREKATEAVIGFLLCIDLIVDPERFGSVDAESLTQAAPSAALIAELEKQFLQKMEFTAGECLHMFYAGVNSQFKGRGIATRLAEKVLENSFAKGYKYAIADCTGPASKKSLEKLGFHEENRIVYANLQLTGPNPFENLDGYCALMVRKLQAGC